MSWTKLGDEFLPAAADLSDAAYRTHTEALSWSSWRLLDLRIPKRDLLRFANTDDPERAAKELVEADWWEDNGDHWWIGVRWPEWQQTRTQVQDKRAKWSADKDRQRKHRDGDHSVCTARSCKYVSTSESAVDSTSESAVDSTGGQVAASNGATRPMSTGGPGVGVGVGTGKHLDGAAYNDAAWLTNRAHGYEAFESPDDPSCVGDQGHHDESDPETPDPARANLAFNQED
jgi:hypothetical protein